VKKNKLFGQWDYIFYQGKIEETSGVRKSRRLLCGFCQFF